MAECDLAFFADVISDAYDDLCLCCESSAPCALPANRSTMCGDGSGLFSEIYANAKAMIETVPDGCRPLIEGASPDPGDPPACLTSAWLSGLWDWLLDMTCPCPALECYYVYMEWTDGTDTFVLSGNVHRTGAANCEYIGEMACDPPCTSPPFDSAAPSATLTFVSGNWKAESDLGWATGGTNSHDPIGTYTEGGADEGWSLVSCVVSDCCYPDIKESPDCDESFVTPTYCALTFEDTIYDCCGGPTGMCISGHTGGTGALIANGTGYLAGAFMNCDPSGYQLICLYVWVYVEQALDEFGCFDHWQVRIKLECYYWNNVNPIWTEEVSGELIGATPCDPTGVAEISIHSTTATVTISESAP